MVVKKKKKDDPGTHFLRKEWHIEKKQYKNPNKDYIPSHERERFDEDKVIKIPTKFNTL